MFFHSSSYTANPIACAAANANLAIWREEPVLERVALLAECEAAGFAQLAEKYPLKNLRQCGSIIAADVEVADAGYLSDLGPRLKAGFYARDVLLRPLGNTIYLMPPYCITPDQLERVFNVIDDVLAELL